jgi:hAT family C-terminal dimerisation region
LSPHTGVNIASHVKGVIESFEIQHKIGYFVLDNASNNDTAMESLGAEFRINGEERRVRCFGHIINLAAKALLFGDDANAFEEELSNGSVASQEEHTHWMKKGPVGKVHIWVVATHSSDILTKSLLELQRKAFEESDDPEERSQKPVTVILDVLTRWLSSFYMIKRALKLRRFYEHHRLEALQRWKKENSNARGKLNGSAKCPTWLSDKARITDEDWAILQGFHDVLQPFHDTLMELEGDGKQRLRRDGTVKAFGLMPRVLLAFEFLLKKLETAKAAVEQEQDGSMFAVNINLGWSKLNEYYSRLQESPAYYAALALHPRHRFQPFEKCWGKDHPDWVDEAKVAVRKLWKNEYSQLPVEEVNNKAPEAETTATLSAFEEFCSDSCVNSASFQSGPSALDEYEQWLNNVDPLDRNVKDALDYWHHQQHRYPRLSAMALDVMTIPAMSADVERLFSDIGVMVTDRRSRLDAMIISIAQVLRSWIRAGLVKKLDDELVLPVVYDEEPVMDTDGGEGAQGSGFDVIGWTWAS